MIKCYKDEYLHQYNIISKSDMFTNQLSDVLSSLLHGTTSYQYIVNVFQLQYGAVYYKYEGETTYGLTTRSCTLINAW